MNFDLGIKIILRFCFLLEKFSIASIHFYHFKIKVNTSYLFTYYLSMSLKVFDLVDLEVLSFKSIIFDSSERGLVDKEG